MRETWKGNPPLSGEAARLFEAWRRHGDDVGDFWGRRRELSFGACFPLFGRPVEVHADDAAFVQAAQQASQRYSRAAPTPSDTLRVDGVVGPGDPDPGPLPEDLGPHMTYSGRRGWATLAAGAWGRAHVDLARREAVVVAHPRLAARPDWLHLRLLDTVFLNLLLADGMGLLHASCLQAAATTLLLLGDHNTGKTTTSLRALESGAFTLLTDSMVFVDADPAGAPRIHGFPVGRLKLRADVAADFRGRFPPGPAVDLQPERVRGETKHVLDLAAFAPDRVRRDAITPSRLCLCLLNRSGRPRTTVRPATPEAVTGAVLRNSLFADDDAAWRTNAVCLAPLLDRASCHHLDAGTDPDGLLRALRRLAGG